MVYVPLFFLCMACIWADIFSPTCHLKTIQAEKFHYSGKYKKQKTYKKTLYPMSSWQ